jgi:hypothetical protein
MHTWTWFAVALFVIGKPGHAINVPQCAALGDACVGTACGGQQDNTTFPVCITSQLHNECNLQNDDWDTYLTYVNDTVYAVDGNAYTSLCIYIYSTLLTVDTGDVYWPVSNVTVNIIAPSRSPTSSTVQPSTTPAVGGEDHTAGTPPSTAIAVTTTVTVQRTTNASSLTVDSNSIKSSDRDKDSGTANAVVVIVFILFTTIVVGALLVVK